MPGDMLISDPVSEVTVSDPEVSDSVSADQETVLDGETFEDDMISDQDPVTSDGVEPDSTVDGGVFFDEFSGSSDDFLGSDVSNPSPDGGIPSVSDPVSDAGPVDSELSGDGFAEVGDISEDPEDLEDVEGVEPSDGSEGDPGFLVYDGQLYTDDGVPVDLLGVLPASVTASNAVYTPTAWQVNLAEHRSFGEHYLMWAQRLYSGSSYYWRYYLALGRDMSYASNVYTYADAEVYSYSSYNSSVTYDVSVSSGSVSGSTYLVYSDLYFDYVGVDPAVSGSVYFLFPLLLLLIVLFMTGGKRNV